MIKQFLKELINYIYDIKRLDAMRNVCIGINESEHFLESVFFYDKN